MKSKRSSNIVWITRKWRGRRWGLPGPHCPSEDSANSSTSSCNFFETHSLAGRITEHSDKQVVFLGELRKNAFAEVRAQMKGRKIDTPVDFRLIHRAHEWRVYDVVIDGASIVSNYRSQFNSIIRDVSYVGLVKKMRQKQLP